MGTWKWLWVGSVACAAVLVTGTGPGATPPGDGAADAQPEMTEVEKKALITETLETVDKAFTELEIGEVALALETLTEGLGGESKSKVRSVSKHITKKLKATLSVTEKAHARWVKLDRMGVDDAGNEPTAPGEYISSLIEYWPPPSAISKPTIDAYVAQQQRHLAKLLKQGDFEGSEAVFYDLSNLLGEEAKAVEKLQKSLTKATGKHEKNKQKASDKQLSSGFTMCLMADSMPCHHTIRHCPRVDSSPKGCCRGAGYKYSEIKRLCSREDASGEYEMYERRYERCTWNGVVIHDAWAWAQENDFGGDCSEPCSPSADCTLMGLCDVGKEGCIAEKRKSCRSAEVCKLEGRCTPAEGECVAQGKDCKRSAACKEQGRCTSDEGRCVKASPE